MDLKSKFGTNLVEARRISKLTQRKLADDSQISVSHLRNIEHGKANTTLDVVERLANVLNMTPEQLLKQ